MFELMDGSICISRDHATREAAKDAQLEARLAAKRHILKAQVELTHARSWLKEINAMTIRAQSAD